MPPAVDARAFKLYGLSLLCSLAYFLFGYDTGSIGSITTLPQFEERFGQLKEITRGAIVSSLLLASALSGIVSGRIADRFSRKYTQAAGAAAFAVGSAISCAAPNLAALVIGRVIAGAGEGLFLSVCNTYIIEIAPKDLRGRLATIPQIFVNIGITLGFFVVYGSQRLQGDIAWRLPMIVQIFVSSCLAAGSPFLPFSPRWLVMQGRITEARQVLDDLMHPSAEAEKEEALAVQPRAQSNQSANIFHKTALPSTLWGCWLQAAQQLTGIDFVLFYAPLLFTQAGLDPKTSSFIASGVTGLVLLTATCVVTPFMDRISRKIALVGGGIGIGISLILIGILYATHANTSTAGRYTIIALIEVFVVVFASTWGMHIRLYTSEQYHPSVRAAASSFGVAVNQLVNCVVALTAPAFLAASSSGPYMLYGSWTAVTAILCWLMMGETRGRSLEAIGSEAVHPHQRLFKAFKRRARAAAQQAPIPLQPIGSGTGARLAAPGADPAARRLSSRQTRPNRNEVFAPSSLNEVVPVFDEEPGADYDLPDDEDGKPSRPQSLATSA